MVNGLKLIVRSLASICLAALMLATGVADEASLLWSSKVQPLFDAQCVKCHGPIEQNSDLELDTPEAALRGGAQGEVILPGSPEESPLYQYLAADSELHMPPDKQLTDAQRAVVHHWIAALGRSPTDEPTIGDQSPDRNSRDFASPTEAIDVLIEKGWRERGVFPAPAADDRTWCRRVYLDLAGRIPTAEELDKFLYSSSAHKRSQLVDELLDSPSYAAHMRELWDVYLMGRGKRRNRDDRRRDNGWWAFLEHAFRENRPWNETVREMLVARPQSQETKGATWFLYERRNRHQEIAEAVAPVVYGTKVDCAQCHDHPLAREIKQAHYWGLVAAFNRSKNSGGSAVSESAVGGFVNFTNLEKESQPAQVVLLTGAGLSEPWPEGDEQPEDSDDNYVDPGADAKTPKYSRREAFAELATEDNPLLARAFVNRMWATLLGRGLVHPVDEMNNRNAPSHPELLNRLAKDFAENQYDVKRLVRGVVLSRAYGLSADYREETPPEAFAYSLERALTAEQIARSWRVCLELSPDDDDLRRAVVAAIPDVLPSTYRATYQQAQFLAGSPELASLLDAESNGVVQRIAAVESRPHKIRKAFVAVLGRSPSADEATRVDAFLDAHPGDPYESARELIWALMTSAEFLTAP